MAAKSIGTISIGLSMNAKRFMKGIAKARKRLNRFRKSAVSLNTKLAAVGAGAAAAGLVLLTKRSLKTIDAQAKLADRLGTTTEALAGLRLASEFTGASASDLDKGFEKMVKRIGDTNFKTSAAALALDRLGLNAEKLIQMKPEQQFFTIADAMADVDSKAVQTALAFDIFGKAGTKLVNMLALGSDGLREIKKESERYGVTVSRIDSAKVEAANDAWLRVKSVLQGVGNQIAVVLSPVIESLSTKFVETATSGTDVGDKVKAAMRVVITVIGKVIDVVGGLRIAYNLVKVSVLGMAKAAISSFEQIEKGAIKLGIIAPEDAMFGPLSQALSEDIGKTLDQIDKLRNAKPAGPQLLRQFDEITRKAQEAAEAVAADREAANNRALKVKGGFSLRQRHPCWAW